MKLFSTSLVILLCFCLSLASGAQTDAKPKNDDQLLRKNAELVSGTGDVEDEYFKFLISGKASEENGFNKQMRRFRRSASSNNLLKEHAYLLQSLLSDDSLPQEHRREFLLTLTDVYQKANRTDQKLKSEIEESYTKLETADKKFASLIRLSRKQAKIDSAAFEKFKDKTISLLSGIGEEELPHPSTQPKEERRNTIRQQIEEALDLLNADKDAEFANRFLSPFGFIHAIATPDQLAKRYMIQNRRRELLVRELQGQLKAELTFDLDGRAAWSPESTNFIWIFADGSWQIIPLNGHGAGPEAKKTVHVNLFEDSDSFPKTDWKTLGSDKSKLESLRHAQKRLLEIVDDPEKESEMHRFCFCPVSLATMAAGSNRTVDGLIAMMGETSEKRKKRMNKHIKTAISDQLSHEPTWQWNGRIALFPPEQDRHSDAFAIWRFYEGRWRCDVGP
jgi:hypothetical protein